jgi:hypothetical protein
MGLAQLVKGLVSSRVLSLGPKFESCWVLPPSWGYTPCRSRFLTDLCAVGVVHRSRD